MNPNEAMDRPVDMAGHIDPNGPALTEKRRESTAEERRQSVTPRASGDYQIRGEKIGAIVDENDEEDGKEAFQITDPFVPFDDLPDERYNVCTIRAVILGCACGAAVNASNVYLGLKTGWTFSANLLGSIVGFAVLKPLSLAVAEGVPILGGGFGPRENNIVQTAATAAGGLGGVFVSGIPALYQLGLLDTPSRDFWALVSLTAVGGYFGFFFATPLRKFFIVYMARELKLIFPSCTATAMTIRSMHAAVGGAEIAKKKMKALGIAFSGAFIQRIVSQYAVGILYDWHVFTWFYIWGNYNNAAINVENWGWIIEFTPAFIGAGMLVGLNVAFSFLGGSVIAWGIIGPTLVKYNAAFGSSFAPDDEKWGDWINYASLRPAFATKDHPSPRYWMLWPGVLCMIVVSFTELFLQYKVIFLAFKAVGKAIAAALSDGLEKAGKHSPFLKKMGTQEIKDPVEDPALPADQVKMWMWTPGLVLSIITICVVAGVEFHLPVSMSILSIFLAFFFAFLAVQCSGVTDITPLTAASKASQIVLGGATKGEGWEPQKAQKLNLIGGVLASIGAGQASDLVGDFRVGYLLRTPPKIQWLAQGIGTIVAIFLAPAMFVLFTKAYPCIIDSEIEHCPFSAPSVAAWKAVAVAVTDPTFPIPKSSGIFAIIFSIFGSFMVIIRHYLFVGEREWMRTYQPNMMAISLAFVLPQTHYGTAMVIGAIPAFYWARKNPQSWDVYGYAVAAGLIAGEGIGGVINAIFQIAGIDGSKYGTGVACPANEC